MDKVGLVFIFSLVGVVGFGALLIVGLIMLREERAAKRAKQAEPGGTLEAKPPSVFGSLFKPAAQRADPPGAHEVLRVLRDHLTGRLIVEIAGQRYAQVSDIGDPNIQQGFVTTLGDLSRFAGGAPQVLSAPVAPITAPASPETLRETPPPATTSTGAAVPAAGAPPRPEPPPHQTSSPAPVSNPRSSDLPPLEMPSMNPFKQMQILRERAKQPPPPPPKPIAEQIDEILQVQVMGTAQAQRGLHVRAGAQGQAVFALDGRAYEAVDDLPDADARALIRAAIAEWERKQ